MLVAASKIRMFPNSPAWRNWQTRWTQNPVIARSCGFKSLRRHRFQASDRILQRGPESYPRDMKTLIRVLVAFAFLCLMLSAHAGEAGLSGVVKYSSGQPIQDAVI